MLTSQKITNIHAFRVASLVHTTAVDFEKEWHITVYAVSIRNESVNFDLVFDKNMFGYCVSNSDSWKKLRIHEITS